MIAFRSLIGTFTCSKSCSSKNCTCRSARNLVRGNESVHGGMETMGSILVGGRASRRTVGEAVLAKSSVGSDSVGTEPNAERECGA
jgi:hypothetical protein